MRLTHAELQVLAELATGGPTPFLSAEPLGPQTRGEGWRSLIARHLVSPNEDKSLQVDEELSDLVGPVFGSGAVVELVLDDTESGEPVLRGWFFAGLAEERGMAPVAPGVFRVYETSRASVTEDLTARLRGGKKVRLSATGSGEQLQRELDATHTNMVGQVLDALIDGALSASAAG